MLWDGEDRRVGGLYRGVVPVAHRHPREGTRFERLTPPGGRPKEAYFRMAVGRGGVIWVTSSGGLLRWKKDSWTRIGKAEGLLANGVTHVAETPDGMVWVAYRDALGITKLGLDEEGRIERTVHHQDGLSSRSLLLVRTDKAGRLWVGGDDVLDVLMEGLARPLKQRFGGLSIAVMRSMRIRRPV